MSVTTTKVTVELAPVDILVNMIESGATLDANAIAELFNAVMGDNVVRQYAEEAVRCLVDQIASERNAAVICDHMESHRFTFQTLLTLRGC